MSQLVCINDYENYALKNLPRNACDYYKSGAGDEQTLNLNRNAFKAYRVRPRVLRDVSNRDLCTTVLGMKISMPLGISPTAMQRMAHPDGECASAKAAGAAGTIFILSTLSTSSIEEVAKAAPNTIKWFQLYVYNDRNVTQQLIQRAEKAGFKALVVTVDTPVLGNRHEDVRNKFSLPNHLRLANLEGVLSNQIQKAVKSSALTEYVATMLDETLNWQGIAWLKSITKLPIILKGILTAEDAILAVQHGASAILVSNHGGRQVDRCPSTIEALPEIVKAVGDKVEIYLDGGVRQGIDVFMALAIGARMDIFI
ncbi:peroxisomal (S)-2-hydroxy-acid oxidase isoform X2 [Cephus cinctus]|uniref:(S)-2-hydroxy-acid oxidase n=1 Tax=Cephus cinctus TaxID=211228 RepID=A0AAJ7C5V3_CEPCN|nr:peroxisomal (S)-2-hydroxy-acid oxidase isoform X2 [Cephus cinctus]